jgi:hypothetical protein
MIIVETPLQSIKVELEKLVAARDVGPHTSMYAKGAIDALSWLISGENPASEGGINHFPPIDQLSENVH